ncbi:hypothetical protein C4568_03655 [Candidatus Parcubacteria bacterium]|nr:MAG: hypothetical protein C4568_03655 [Candidatus Parcubacteria bacterium]
MRQEKTKTVSQGEWRLEYRQYRDDWGFLRNAFEMIYTHPNGRKTHIPFMAVGLNTATRDTPIGDIVDEFTSDDLSKIFDEQVKKCKPIIAELLSKENS